MQLEYQGYGKGEPIIILHGLFGSRENWHGISTVLAERFEVFALDQRNHGRSPHSFEMDYRIMAQDVFEFLREHQLSRAHVLGHSMGGKTAMQLALLHPDQVQSLIVVDIAPRAYAPRHEKIIDALTTLDLGRYKARQEIEIVLATAIPDLATRQFLLKNLSRHAGGVFYWRIGLEEIRQSYFRLSAPIEAGSPYGGAALFIRGANSDYLLTEDMRDIWRLFPNARLETVPRASHLPHLENREALLQVVLKFLRA